MNKDNDRFPLESGFSKLHWRVMWTHKIHAAFLEHLVKVNRIVKIVKYTVSSILSALTIISAAFLSPGWTIASAVLTSVSVLTGLILENIYSDKKVECQKTNVNKLCELRDKIKLEIDCQCIKDQHDSIDTIAANKEKIKELLRQVNEIEQALEAVPRKYVDIAECRLKNENDEGD